MSIQASPSPITRTASPLGGKIAGFLRTQWPWLIAIIPLLILMARPLRWFWRNQTAPDSTTAILLLVPIGAALLAWSRRQEMTSMSAEMASLFPADSPKRRGNVSLVLVGCFLALLAAVTALMPLAMLGLIFITAGIVFLLYGPFILKSLTQPLLFLLPLLLPATVSTRLAATMQLGVANTTGNLLRTFQNQIELRGATLLNGGQSVEVTAAGSGAGLVLTAFIGAWWLASLRRLQPGYAIVLVVASVFVALLLSILRILIIGAIAGSNGGAAQTLLSIPMWIFVLPVAAAVYAIGQRLEGIAARRASTRGGIG